jgi:hypothetical protein
MAVPQPGGSSAAPKGLAPRGKLGVMPPGGWLAAASLVVTGAVLAIQWPTAAVLFGLLLVVLVLCVRAPVYAFALALVLFSFEGTIKMRLSVEGAPSPVAIGAACLDFAFLASLTALLVHDRGRALVRVWERARAWSASPPLCSPRGSCCPCSRSPSAGISSTGSRASA